jgi:cell division protein FtsL
MTAWRQWLERLQGAWRDKPAVGPRESKGDVSGAGQSLLTLSELARPAGTLALLVLLVLASALMVIYSAYEYRRLFNQHQILSSQGDDLQVEWGQLLLEESAWSANNRVERLADKKLNMKVPEPEGIEIVRHEPR